MRKLVLILKLRKENIDLKFSKF